MANFYTKMLPVANVVSDMTGIYPSVILALMAHESAYGTSKLARTSGNYAGISDMDGKKNSWSKSVGFAPRPKNEGAYYTKYNTLMQFAHDLGTLLGFSYYKNVRNALTPEGQIKALGASPYATDPKHGSKILAIWKKDGLKKYDSKKSNVIPESQTDGFKETIENKADEMTAEELSKMAMIGIGFAILVGMLND